MKLTTTNKHGTGPCPNPVSRTIKFLLIIIALVGFGMGVQPSYAVIFGPGHEVNFMGVQYDDPATGQSTWFYEVKSTGTGPAISHVTFGINTCAKILGAGKWAGPTGFNTRYPGQGSPQPGSFPATPTTDPTTGITGLKFDEGFDEDETKYYYYTLDGNYKVEPTTMAVKPGNNSYTGTIDGPSPTCEEIVGEEYDFGDAPDPTYPTYLVNDGARHLIGDIWMGSAVDAETDGQPTDQDDALGATPDDEDGVVFLGSSPSSGGPYSPPFVAGQYGAVQITVSGAQKTSYLHGWYDWNKNGNWDDAGEHLFSNYTISGPGTYMTSSTT